jgi:hypothetical protein
LIPDDFYDGNGVYKVRFMPDAQGEWRYRTISNIPPLDDIQGSFICTPARDSNHGPVGISNTYHFSYADGTPYLIKFSEHKKTVVRWSEHLNK